MIHFEGNLSPHAYNTKLFKNIRYYIQEGQHQINIVLELDFQPECFINYDRYAKDMQPHYIDYIFRHIRNTHSVNLETKVVQYGGIEFFCFTHIQCIKYILTKRCSCYLKHRICPLIGKVEALLLNDNEYSGIEKPIGNGYSIFL